MDSFKLTRGEVMKKVHIKINGKNLQTVKLYNDFVDWILSDYSREDLIEMLGGEETKEDVALSVAGMFPHEYIENYTEIEPFIDEENKGEDFIYRIQEEWEVKFVDRKRADIFKKFQRRKKL